MCRRCDGTGQTQSLPDHLCRSDGQIRTATRRRGIGSKTYFHAAVLPRGVRPEKWNGRTDRESERTAKDAHGRYCRTPSTATSRADRLQHYRRTAEEEERRIGESRNGVGTDAAGDQDRQTQRRGRGCHDESRRKDRSVIPRPQAREVWKTDCRFARGNCRQG